MATDYAKARRLLARRDPVLRDLIREHGPCGLADAQHADPFRALVSAIISQQLSTRAAATIKARLETLAGAPLTPSRVASIDDEALRGVGLSRQKISYLRDLCGRETEKWRGETALMWAAGENNAAAAKVLLAHGANINAQSRQIDYPEMRLNLSFMATTELPRGGMSPVMLAAREGGLDSARVLADAKANLDLQDPEGTTALMLAIMNVHYDVALMLIEKGAKPNVYDKAAMGALYAVVDMRTQRPLTNMPPRKPSSDVDSLDVVKRAPEARRRCQRRAEDDAAAAPPQHGRRLAWRRNDAADACRPVRRCGRDAGAYRGGCRRVEAAAERKLRVAVCVRRRIPNRRRWVRAHGQGNGGRCDRRDQAVPRRWR